MPKQEKVGAQLRRIFDNGNGRDLSWKEYLFKSGLSLVKSKKGVCPKCGDSRADLGRHICMPEHAIRGEFDDLVRNPHDGSIEIVEIKTMREDLWKDLKGARGDHILQTYPYMKASGAERALIVYENKNNQDVKIFREPFLWKTWEGLLARLAGIVLAIDNDWLPQRTPVANEKGCPFYWMCPVADIKKLKKEAGLDA